jgi:hypothetical protein
MLKSIKGGRHRFLKHQAAVVDGYRELLDGYSSLGSAQRMAAEMSLGGAVGFKESSNGVSLQVVGSRAASGHHHHHHHPQVQHDAGSRRRARLRLRPTVVVEAVADLLLDELLEQQVLELESMCESICSQLIEDEML